MGTGSPGKKPWAKWLTIRPTLTKQGLPYRLKIDASTELFNIGVTANSSSLATGTYSPDNSFLSLSYMKNVNTSNITTYTGGGFLGGADTRYEVTITAVTDKVVKGSFTGTFIRNMADDTDIVNITEGEFVLERVR